MGRRDRQDRLDAPVDGEGPGQLGSAATGRRQAEGKHRATARPPGPEGVGQGVGKTPTLPDTPVLDGPVRQEDRLTDQDQPAGEPTRVPLRPDPPDGRDP